MTLRYLNFFSLICNIKRLIDKVTLYFIILYNISVYLFYTITFSILKGYTKKLN